MNKNKKIIFVFSLFVFLALAIWVFLENSDFSFKKPFVPKESNTQENFFSENNFEDREKMISQFLSQKIGIASEKVSVLIAQEDGNHVVGIYFAGLSEDKNISGKFFGVINNSIEIVWYGEENPDCELLLKNNFSSEMIPGCF